MVFFFLGASAPLPCVCAKYWFLLGSTSETGAPFTRSFQITPGILLWRILFQGFYPLHGYQAQSLGRLFFFLLMGDEFSCESSLQTFPCASGLNIMPVLFFPPFLSRYCFMYFLGFVGWRCPGSLFVDDEVQFARREYVFLVFLTVLLPDFFSQRFVLSPALLGTLQV